jgi:hypothetical protein
MAIGNFSMNYASNLRKSDNINIGRKSKSWLSL